MLKKIIDRAWDLQYWIEERIWPFPIVKLHIYFLFITIVFFITGYVLLMYCFLINQNIFELAVLSCPIFYLVQGTFFCLIYVFSYISFKRRKNYL